MLHTTYCGIRSQVHSPVKKNSVGLENRIRIFAGQYFDAETGLHYNWHRYYDPETGRYLRPDPIGLAGGINLFAYGNCNPLNLVDFKGLDAGVISIPATTYTFLKAAIFVSSAMVAADLLTDIREDGCSRERNKITLYRGVHGNHPALNHAKAGMAVPWGGHNDPELHNLGDVHSIFTSWSIYRDVAAHRASLYESEAPGVILRKDFFVDDPQIVPSPNVADPNEGEVLIQGVVYGADVIKP